ncbi:spindle assembly abnormal protein 6 homolog isoform X2 [Dunckerocampus dactyliophorus]|uniref:spindle assembly abnormal protein 6 homolog isoform X2 n=1 Tax=Dunckerocampus dactyliophorus TaxID=161453 RepID=UPI002404E9EF|nr:spindle assembly abnormal protein 6 homolog isoform X2 [Dunckerocampus dactyliophorus]
METMFSKVVQVNVRCRDCEERKAHIRVAVELQSSKSAVHKRDLLVRLTDDVDPSFLFSLIISEEDFQSLKVQQGLLIDFSSFPEKLTELLNLCQSEQQSSHPRFQLLLSCDSALLEGLVHLSVVETNSFRNLNHLSLRLTQGSDKHIKDYLAECLSSVKVEKQALEVKLQKTEEDLSRQLNYAQQTLSEKTKELDKLHSEWTLQTSSLSSRHSNELRTEREKNAELQSRLQQEMQKLRHDLESAHQESSQQLQTIRDLKTKLAGVEEECQRSKQQVVSLRRDNSSLDTALHEKERLSNQLQIRVAVLEQEVKDKDQLMNHTREVHQQQKESVKEKAETKELEVRKLEAEVKFLSDDLKKAIEIIKKFQGELRACSDKNKAQYTALVAQKKVVQETSAKLERAHEDFHKTQQQLSNKDQQVEKLTGQVEKLTEQLEDSLKKLSETKDLLQSNENVIIWLNKQLNEKELSKKPLLPQALESTSVLSSAGLRTHFYPQAAKTSPSPVVAPDLTPVPKHTESVGLDPKYLGRQADSIPVYGLPAGLLPREIPPPRSKPPVPSAYFPN